MGAGERWDRRGRVGWRSRRAASRRWEGRRLTGACSPLAGRELAGWRSCTGRDVGAGGVVVAAEVAVWTYLVGSRAVSLFQV